MLRAAILFGALSLPAVANATAGSEDDRRQPIRPAASGRAPEAIVPRQAPPGSGAAILQAHELSLLFPYGVIYDTWENDLWIGDLGAFDFPGDGLVHRVRTDGTVTADTIDGRDLGINPMDGAYDPATRMLWQMSGLFGIGCANELDPVAKVPTNHAICPPFSTQQDALAYDPTTETFYSGSLDDSVVTHFDRSGAILETAVVAFVISGLAYNPATAHLFVLHAAQDALPGEPDIVVVAPDNDYEVVKTFFVGDGSWSYGMRGMDLDCDGHLWLVSQPDETPFLLEIDSGESGPCEAGIAVAHPSASISR